MKGHTSKCFILVVEWFSILFSVVGGVISLNTPVYAESVISVEIDDGPIVLDLLPKKANGTFAQSSNFNIGIEVNGPGGYTLGIASDGSTELVNQRDNVSTLTSISDSVSVNDFSADTTVAGNNYNGKWGYLPSKFDSVSNSVFQPAPNSDGDVLDVTRGKNAQGEYTIAIGARADMSLAPGSYTNTFVITAVSNYSCSVGEVCYFDNDADGGVMENQVIPAEATEIQLAGSNYYRAGYGFAGWSPTLLDPDDANFASDFANATVYGPSETVEIPAVDYLPLYAVWVPSEGNLQTWDGCSSLNIGETIGLTDTRDGNVYAVAKLADGKCWQTENLRLDFSNENVEITSLNTNHPMPKFMSDANKHPEQTNDFSGKYTTDIKYSRARLSDNYIEGIHYGYYTYRGGNGNVGAKNRSTVGDICPAGWHISESYSSLITSLVGKALNPFTETTEPTSESVKKAVTAYPNNFVKSRTKGLFYVNNIYGDGGSGQSTAYGMFEYQDKFYSSWTWTSEPNKEAWIFHCVEGDTESYTLNYDANGGTNAPSSENISSHSGIFSSITSSVPIRSGFTFVGWVDDDGVEVQPGGSYNAGVGNTNVTLFAIWVNNNCNDSATTIGTGNPTDARCLQDMNGAVRNAMFEANEVAGSIQTFQLFDARDNQNYDIALLDDGNVWMTKNLNLGGNNTILLNHYESDISNANVHFLKARESWNSDNNYYTGDSDDGYYNGVYYGGYYKWDGVVVYDQALDSYVNLNDSICPSGWNLPTVAQYSDLISAVPLLDAASATASPYSFTSGGRMSLYSSNYEVYHSYSDQGSKGYYWTLPSKNVTTHYVYFFNSNSLNVATTVSDAYSLNVRCVARNGAITINYDGNGSVDYPTTGLMPSKKVEINTGIIESNKFTRYGYTFKNWNTRADGTGEDISAKTDIYTLGFSDGDEITLYAQWTPLAVITYNDNYNDKTMVRNFSPGSSAQLLDYNAFTTKEGYSIKEWNTKPDGSGETYALKYNYVVPADLSEPIELTLYAQWIKDCEITYVNTITGETQTKSLKWNRSGNLTPPIDWTYSNYRITGWDIVNNSGTGGGGTISYAYSQNVTLTSDLTLYTVWEPYYTLRYDGNGATGIAGMSVTNEFGANEEITLYASGFSRSGYGFAGWSFDSDAANDLQNATIYGPNATIVAPAMSVPGEAKTLYAVWIKAESGVTMQTFDATVAPYSTAEIGTVIALTDTRDNDTYAVAKLADGKWWMIENLRLGEATDISLTNTDTAITETSLTLNASVNSMNASPYTIRMNASNKLSPANPMGAANANAFLYGNYYSWAASILSTSTYSSTTVNRSVCPYGWHIPSGSGSGEFANLSINLGGLETTMNSNSSPTGAEFSKTIRAFPNNFVYSGYWYTSSVYLRGTDGYYWSSTSFSSQNAYYLSINSTTVSPANADRARYYASSVRCMAN